MWVNLALLLIQCVYAGITIVYLILAHRDWKASKERLKEASEVFRGIQQLADVAGRIHQIGARVVDIKHYRDN